MKQLENDINNLINNSTLPILVSGISASNFSNKVVIDANIDRNELIVIDSHPAWLVKLELLSKKHNNTVLLISNLCTINESEQNKFLELLKYKSISGFKIPENSHIVITCSNLDKISDNIKSFCAIVKADDYE